ncbi:hypothetical protein C882_2589 [Caenispirillum salinarum AK4]|uniref:Uncharacterized protein n=1 Tax=Caenispirillum salinarum AK4 TaxID=1238182 RepID=K9H2N0_9PROT|nr:hypothetical protein C882_2589 [Caenispirillum salinarum AK4]
MRFVACRHGHRHHHDVTTDREREGASPSHPFIAPQARSRR